ncbi:hypothetical protein F2Q69_00055063 [Brassica cretica]|uniref:Uncharacterized protein n=1 Tax=Brassica cretica TaxID=69181 RepID=A0A8S9N1I9_BRACR|nr:hypothetical protein F2Q69_00055063 [Brassica cretica]
MSSGGADNSYATNSLLQVPQGLEKNTSSVYITTSSLPSAYEAYLNQFQRGFGTFLRMRSEEMIHGFDLGQSSSNNEEGGAGEKEAKCIRAVSESMLVAHFGDDIIDALFYKFAYHASQHAGCTSETTVTLVVSLNRENNKLSM